MTPRQLCYHVTMLRRVCRPHTPTTGSVRRGSAPWREQARCAPDGHELRYLRIRLHFANYWRNPAFKAPPAYARAPLLPRVLPVRCRVQCAPPTRRRVGHLPESPIDSTDELFRVPLSLLFFPFPPPSPLALSFLSASLYLARPMNGRYSLTYCSAIPPSSRIADSFRCLFPDREEDSGSRRG